MDTSTLKEAGFTEGEIKIYSALLELGSSTTGPIVKKSKVAKSIVYQILEKLITKGLVSYTIKEKTKYFQASEPTRILEYLEEREKRLKENIAKIQKDLPHLFSVQTSTSRREVRVFEGFKGMITVHEHTYQKLKRNEEFFYLGIAPEQPEYFHAYWQKDHLRRIKAGIKCRLLFHPKTDPNILKNRNSYNGCEARYMPIEINTPAWFMGYKDTAVIGFPSSNPLTIEIASAEVADSFRSYFEQFWKHSNKFKK